MSLKLAAPRLLFVFLGFFVLFLSLTRASLEIVATDNDAGELKKDPINITIVYSDGKIEETSYKLPEVNTLPNHPFYGFKQLRDWLLLTFTSCPFNKAKLILLFADKKIAESRQLFNNNQPQAALQAAQEGISQLQKAQTTLDSVVSTVENRNQILDLNNETFKAGFSYRQVLGSKASTFDLDSQAYQGIIKTLDDWNETQKAAKENQTE